MVGVDFMRPAKSGTAPTPKARRSSRFGALL